MTLHEIATSDYFTILAGAASILGLVLTIFITNKVIKVNNKTTNIDKKIDTLKQYNTHGDNNASL